MNEIIPAVLGRTEEIFKTELDAIPAEIPLIQIDVLEEDVWINPERDFEAHLMVENPDKVLEHWIKRGAKRIVAHQLTSEVIAAKSKVKIGLGVEMGVALEGIFDMIPYVDFVQLMAIDEIGEQGHPLNEKIFDRIKMVKHKFPNVSVSIDGGVNEENFQKLLDAGADQLVVGSHFQEVWRLIQNK
jgi:ribulose-phosphate 3-epimerase